MSEIQKVLNLLKKNNGIITTKQVEEIGINNKVLTRMIEKGLIERVARGVYIDIKEIEDTYVTSQAICRKGIFSNETALYLHGLSERTPIKYTFTIPSGYNTKLLKDKKYNFFYSKKEIYELGTCKINTPYGNKVLVYDIERTICDVIKNKDKLDISIVSSAIRDYLKNTNRDLIKLHSYAKKLNIDEKVGEYLEVLL